MGPDRQFNMPKASPQAERQRVVSKMKAKNVRHHRGPDLLLPVSRGECSKETLVGFPTHAPEQRSVARFCQPSGGSVAVYLQSRDAQAGNPMRFDRKLPGEEFLYR